MPTYKSYWLLLFILCFPVWSYAGGISVDAGLTPAEDRLILRSQMNYQAPGPASEANLERDQFAFPLVGAYGLKRWATLMVRGAYAHSRTLENGKEVSSTNGLADPMIQGKFRVLRINRPGFILGVAPIIGTQVPAGSSNLRGDDWRPRAGLFTSLRMGPWAIDLNTAYVWPNAEVFSGQHWNSSLAAARQFSLNEHATITLAPVAELNYLHEVGEPWDEQPLLVGTGLKLTIQSFVIEALYQNPYFQSASTAGSDRYLFGLRWMM